MKYWEQCLSYLKSHGQITCKDVQNITNCTSPHTVIKQLRDKRYLGRYEDRVSNGKQYRVHYYLEVMF